MPNQETALHEAPSGEVRVNELNQQAWAVRVTNSNQAFRLSGEAVALANQLHYQRGLAEGLRTLGFCHIRTSRYPEALDLLRQASAIFEELHHEQGLSDVYEYFGIIHRTQGDYAASLDALFKSLQLRQQLQDKEGLALAFYHTGVTYKYLGDFDNALHYSLQGLPIAQEVQLEMPESYLLNSLGGIYFETHDYEAALTYYNKSLTLRQRIGDQWGEAGCLDNIGTILLRQQKVEEALYFFERGLAICNTIGDPKGQSNTLLHLAKIQYQTGNAGAAIDYVNQSLAIRQRIGDKKGQAEIGLFLGELHQYSQPGYALRLLQQSLELGELVHAKDLVYKIHQTLAETLKQTGNFEDALTHFELARDLEKRVNSESVNQKLHNLQITHRVEQARKEAEIYQLRNQELAALVAEIGHQKESLSQTVQELRATQTQLIQREKMASLGELMAGIAHEIQNPLNFVTNFSDVSAELVSELQDEQQKPIRDPELEADLLGDLTENLQKISHHGQRASSIVRSMLEHSRASTGQREATDLNALCDQYLRLAYQGFRVKDKAFFCELVTRFSPDLPTVELVAQDIGRVLLNLFNNAFYAVQQRQKQHAIVSTTPDYVPTMTVSIEQVPNGVCIRVMDNGAGILDGIRAKIFQPFFTTKPTGEGTGLGLSLSYDIITKGHGGTLDVDTSEGKFTELRVVLPCL